MLKKILIVASSLDGYIAQERHQISTDWTSKADRDFFVKTTKEIGTMLMGRTTFETIGKPLPGRTTVLLSSQQEYPGAQDLATYHADHNFYLSRGRSEAEVLQLLADQGVTQVAICGGASVYQKFLENDLVDEMYLTIEPVFLGSGIKLLPNGLPQPKTWQVVERLEISDATTVLHLSR